MTEEEHEAQARQDIVKIISRMYPGSSFAHLVLDLSACPSSVMLTDYASGAKRGVDLNEEWPSRNHTELRDATEAFPTEWLDGFDEGMGYGWLDLPLESIKENL